MNFTIASPSLILFPKSRNDGSKTVFQHTDSFVSHPIKISPSPITNRSHMITPISQNIPGDSNLSKNYQSLAKKITLLVLIRYPIH